MDPVRTIDEVIDQLTQIVKRSRERGSCDGYFAALYRMVTIEVRQRISAGWFENGPRMERFDVIFASRYLDAWSRREAGGAAGAAWTAAFSIERAFWPVVLQHLLLGMNAHINLDLGLAAAATAPGPQIAELKGDFVRINQLLADLVKGVEDRLAQVWHPLRWLDGLAGGADEAVINFSLGAARDCAWQLATEAAAEPDPEALAVRADQADKWAAVIGRRVLHPGFATSRVLNLVRLYERGSVADKLTVMGA
jgi:hypothetical protein